MQLFGHDRQTTHRDVIEAYCCHMFIDPLCYGWLSQRLGLDSPHARLAVPRFYLSAGTGDKDQPGGSQVKTSRLTQEERREILNQLAEEKLQRKQVTATSFAVVVDGAEYARIDLDGESTERCEIQEGAKLIEIWMQGQGKRFLLATHWIEYTEWHGIADARAVVALGNGKELLLELVPANRANENVGGASVLLTYRRASRLGAWMESLKGLKWLLRSPKFALAVVLLAAIAGVLGTVKYHLESTRQQAAAEILRRQLSWEKSERASLQQQLDKKRDSASLVAYRLTPEDFNARGGQGIKEPIVSLPPGTALVVLELPVSSQRTSYRATLKSFLENQEVLSEGSLQPEPRNGSTVVSFALPSSLVTDRKHYVVTLHPIGSSGRSDRVRTFTFYLVKK